MEGLRYGRLDCQLRDLVRRLLLGPRRAMPHHGKRICECIGERFLRGSLVRFLGLALCCRSVVCTGERDGHRDKQRKRKSRHCCLVDVHSSHTRRRRLLRRSHLRFTVTVRISYLSIQERRATPAAKHGVRLVAREIAPRAAQARRPDDPLACRAVLCGCEDPALPQQRLGEGR